MGRYFLIGRRESRTVFRKVDVVDLPVYSVSLVARERAVIKER
jgi:hypothetical protein